MISANVEAATVTKHAAIINLVMRGSFVKEFREFFQVVGGIYPQD
jgi:hypothetical protein